MNSIILKKMEHSDTATLVTLAHFSHFRHSLLGAHGIEINQELIGQPAQGFEYQRNPHRKHSG